jgi:hypothetical protein
VSWNIEAVIADLIATIDAGVPAFLSVEEAGEAIPPDGPFCLVEHLGGPVDLGNLEDWTISFRLTAGVGRNQMIGQERKAVRGFALQIIEALRGNHVLAGVAFLTNQAEVGVSGEMSYANAPFVGCSVTVGYQITEGVENTYHD